MPARLARAEVWVPLRAVRPGLRVLRAPSEEGAFQPCFDVTSHTETELPISWFSSYWQYDELAVASHAIDSAVHLPFLHCAPSHALLGFIAELGHLQHTGLQSL
jgi:hypothetical protein